MFWGVVSRIGLSKDVIRCETIISLRTINEVKVPYFRHFSFKLLFTCCVR